MKEKVPVVTSEGKDQGSQLLTSSPALLLIHTVVTLSLLLELLTLLKESHFGIKMLTLFSRGDDFIFLFLSVHPASVSHIALHI